jgi:protein O-GlcNAc transferase
MNRTNPNAAKHNRLLAQIQEIYALYQKAQHTKAQQQVTRLLAKNPKSSHAHTLAAMIAVALDDQERALYHAQSAIKLDPQNPDAQTTIASIHALSGNNKSALEHYSKALAIQPNHPGALAGLGTAQSELGQYQHARTTLKQVQDLNPTLPEPLVNRALLELDTTHAHRAIEILESAPPNIAKHPAALDLYALAHSYDDTKTPEQTFAAHKRYGDELESQIPPSKHTNTKDPQRKLKVGYLSGDLHQHSNSYYLEPILKNTNKDQFETHIFTTSAHRDHITERLNDCVDHWHLCNTMSLPQLVKHIKDQQIDILIELAGHFAGHKLPVFAGTPAPVQITFIGYGNTTGLTRINARFVDSITDPEGSDHLATESLVRLPGCFLCYQPPLDELPDPLEPETTRPFTLGSFNNLKKLSQSTINTWSTILKERPETTLLIKSSKLANEELKSELLQRFADQGIDQSRLDLRAFSPTTSDHLDTYNDLDLALDTFPYTGTTTTCEALAMGILVLTLLGEAHAGRVSASLLTAIDQPDLIAESEQDYITKALKHIDAGKRSKQSRQALRDQLLNSPLCDQAPYTRKVEDAYRTLWTQWCASK